VDFEISANLQTERKTRPVKIAPAFSVNKQKNPSQHSTNKSSLVDSTLNMQQQMGMVNNDNNDDGQMRNMMMLPLLMQQHESLLFCLPLNSNDFCKTKLAFLLFKFLNSQLALLMLVMQINKSHHVQLLTFLFVCFVFCYCCCCLLLFDMKNLLVDPLPLHWCCC